MKTKASPFYIPSLSEFELKSQIFNIQLNLSGNFPRRVLIGETLLEDKNFKVLSSINGIASVDDELNIILTQDGNLNYQPTKELKFFGKSELLKKLDSTALISFDFKEKNLSNLFQNLKPDGKIILTPLTRENFFSYKELVLKTYLEEYEFLKSHLAKLFPDASIIDFFSDKNLKEEYPIGIPEYFISNKFAVNEPIFPHSKFLYLGGETIFHLIRSIYYNIPFHERIVQFLFIKENGEINKESKWLKNGTKLDFTEFQETYPSFSLNCFYKSEKVFPTTEGFLLDINSTYAFLFSKNIPSKNIELECIDCGECDFFCPTNAEPRSLLDKSNIKFQKNLCIECGICSLKCPSKIDLKERIKKEKQVNEN